MIKYLSAIYRGDDKMSNVLITGSVMNHDTSSINIYEEIVNICMKNKCNVSSPLDTMKFNGSDKERYDRAMKLINDADCIIAEMSSPSTGQGMELQQAIINKIPIIIIARNNSKISSMIKGNNFVKEILFYNDIKDIEDKIIKFINL